MIKYLLIFVSIVSFSGFYLRPSLAVLERVPTGEVGSPPTDCRALWWKDSAHPTCSQKKFCGVFTYKGLQTFESSAECLGQAPSPATIPIEPPPPQSWWERISKSVVAFISRIFSVFEGKAKTVKEGTLFIIFRRGPISPICILGQPCDAPAVNFPFQIRQKESSETVLSAKSDKEGRYQIQLKSGQYFLEYQPHQIEKFSLKDQEFTMIAGQTTPLNISIDTGIR